MIEEYARYFNIESEDGPTDLTIYQGYVVEAVVRSLNDGKKGYRVFLIGEDQVGTSEPAIEEDEDGIANK